MTTKGRPPYEPTAVSRGQIAMLAGAGWSHQDMADLLGIDRHTLEKHFAHELKGGARERRAAVVAAVERAAKKGNIAAARLYLTGTHRTEPPTPTDASLEIVSMPSQATGVKAQRNEDAKVAQQGTEWATLLPSSVQ